MTIYYRSPHSGSVAAVTAPARLELELNKGFWGEAADVLWREAGDGGIEVAVHVGDVVERLRVRDDGSLSQLQKVALASTDFAGRLGSIGLCLLVLGFVMAFVTAAVSHVGVPPLAAPLLIGIGFGVLAVAGVLAKRAERISGHWMSHIGSGWHLPTNLRGWVPDSATQLAVVESIADRHDGLAWVRDAGGTSITVRTSRWRGFSYSQSFDYYLVEADGFVINQASDSLSTGSADREAWIAIRTQDSDDGD